MEMPSPAILSDISDDRIAIELSLTRWASTSSGELSSSLERGILSGISVRVGEGKIGKDNCVFSIEEILDLEALIKSFSSKEEDEFDWSTVEPSVQMLRVYRETQAIHTEILVKLFGFPEGYSGNATLSFQFDIAETSLRNFEGGIRAQLLALLRGDESALHALQQKLQQKKDLIRKSGKRPLIDREAS